ncbi:MAG: hypothetical protein ACXVX0_17640 [Blastococcus sp.]
MNGDVTPHSGSRWEPAGGPFPQGHPLEPDSAAAGPHTARRPRRRVTKTLSGLGLVLVGGAGGFALGHAAAGQDGVRVGTSSVTVPQDGDGDHRRPDFGNGTPPSGAPGPGDGGNGQFQGDDGGSSGDGSA